MQVEGKTITKEEIAQLLRMRPQTFQKKRRPMEAEGMPRPIPGAGLLWSRKNIMLWLDGELIQAPAESVDA